MELEESMEAIIERLREERAEATQEYQKAGYDNGYAWARNSSYSDLQYMLLFDPSVDGGYCNYTWDGFAKDDTLGDGFREEFEEDPVLFQTDKWGGFMNDGFNRWFEGWKEGVASFWQEVKDKL